MLWHSVWALTCKKTKDFSPSECPHKQHDTVSRATFCPQTVAISALLQDMIPFIQVDWYQNFLEACYIVLQGSRRHAVRLQFWYISPSPQTVWLHTLQQEPYLFTQHPFSFATLLWFCNSDKEMVSRVTTAVTVLWTGRSGVRTKAGTWHSSQLSRDNKRFWTEGYRHS